LVTTFRHQVEGENVFDVWTIFGLIAGFCISGAVGALIAEHKNQPQAAGFLLGAVLGFIGLAIIAMFPRSLPKAPPGRWALMCPRCNAIQNIFDDDEVFMCWQCEHEEAVDDLLAR
jgi:hypothetical protein